MVSIHGNKFSRKYKDSNGEMKKFATIIDGVPLRMGHKSRWAALKNPFTGKLYKCVRNKLSPYNKPISEYEQFTRRMHELSKHRKIRKG